MQPAAPAGTTEYDPAEHTMQADAPCELAYDPATHAVHAAASDAPASELNWPAAHAAGWAAPPAQTKPWLHVVQEQPPGDAAPTTVEAVPGVQPQVVALEDAGGQ